MKKQFNERVLFFLVFLLLVILVINAGYKHKKYYVFNNNTGKLYGYQYLEPNEKKRWDLDDPDSISVVTRLIAKNPADSVYSYQISFDGLERTVTRNLNISSVSRGVNGDKVTSWNRFRGFVSEPTKGVIIHNTSGYELLVKFKPDKRIKTHRDNSESRYIAYPPDFYDQSYTIMINDNDYTYYQGKYNGIGLDLQGPVNLKIINRLIIEQVESLSFSWKVLIDGKEVLYQEDSLPFSSSCLADSTSQVTQGNVNILQIPAGKHHIRIIDEAPKGIIYRLYISKSAIGN